MNHLGQRISALVDGELSHTERDRALAHLVGCESCRREAVALRVLKQRMLALGEATAADSLTDRLIALATAGLPALGRSRPPSAAGGRPLGHRLRWPVRSLALAALALAGLALPAVAFVAGGADRAPGPAVTPAVDMFSVQHAITAGAVPEQPASPRAAGMSAPATTAVQGASSPPAVDGLDLSAPGLDGPGAVSASPAVVAGSASPSSAPTPGPSPGHRGARYPSGAQGR